MSMAMHLDALEESLARAKRDMERLRERPAGMTHKRHILELRATCNELRHLRAYIEKYGVLVDEGCGKYRIVPGDVVAGL